MDFITVLFWILIIGIIMALFFLLIMIHNISKQLQELEESLGLFNLELNNFLQEIETEKLNVENIIQEMTKDTK